MYLHSKLYRNIMPMRYNLYPIIQSIINRFYFPDNRLRVSSPIPYTSVLWLHVAVVFMFCSVLLYYCVWWVLSGIVITAPGKRKLISLLLVEL